MIQRRLALLAAGGLALLVLFTTRPDQTGRIGSSEGRSASSVDDQIVASAASRASQQRVPVAGSTKFESVPAEDDVEGYVLDGTTSLPVGGARVVLLWSASLDPFPGSEIESGAFVSETISAADGAFRLEVPRRGLFEVQASKPGYAPSRRIDAESAKPIALSVTPCNPLRGVVLGPSRTPYLGPGTVRVLRHERPARPDTVLVTSLSTGGRFDACLAEGIYAVVVETPAHPPCRVRGVQVSRVNSPEITVQIQEDCVLRGVVQTEAGRGVPDARIALAGQSFHPAESAPDGGFALPVACGERSIVRIEARGFAPLEAAVDPVFVTEGRTATFTVLRGACVEGIVVDEAGAGVPGARAFVFCTGGSQVLGGRRFVSDVTLRTTCDESGGFRFEDVPVPFAASLLVVTPLGSRRGVFLPAMKVGEHVDLGVLRVEESSRVTGRVVNGLGNPVHGATLTITAGGFGREQFSGASRAAQYPGRGAVLDYTTDPDGVFTARGLEPGEYEIIAIDAEGADYPSIPLVLTRAEQVDLGDLWPSGPGSPAVSGRLEVPGARLDVDAWFLRVAGAAGHHDCLVGGDGTYSLPGRIVGNVNRVEVLTRRQDGYQRVPTAQVSWAEGFVRAAPVEELIVTCGGGARRCQGFHLVDSWTETSFRWYGTFRGGNRFAVLCTDGSKLRMFCGGDMVWEGPCDGIRELALGLGQK